MRASEMLVEVRRDMRVVKGRRVPSAEAFVDALAVLARLESAVEALAADAGTGPARRIKEILDGEATP